MGGFVNAIHRLTTAAADIVAGFTVNDAARGRDDYLAFLGVFAFIPAAAKLTR
jgi:hypothetical protein